MFGFITCLDYVSDNSVMDLSIYEYSSAFCDNLSLLAPYSPTSQIFDIDDEISQHDSYERATILVGNVEIVDFSIADQPRELKIGSPLSIDEMNNLIHLLRSYLDVFACHMRTCQVSIPLLFSHLPILPHARLVK